MRFDAADDDAEADDSDDSEPGPSPVRLVVTVSVSVAADELAEAKVRVVDPDRSPVENSWCKMAAKCERGKGDGADKKSDVDTTHAHDRSGSSKKKKKKKKKRKAFNPPWPSPVSRPLTPKQPPQTTG